MTFVEGGAVRALSFHPADGSISSVTAFQLPDPANPTANSFVLPRGPDDATLFWPGRAAAPPGHLLGRLYAGAWGTKSAVPGQGDSDASAALDGDGRTWLFANGTVAGNVDVYLRTRNPATREWSASGHVVSGPGADQFAYPVFVAGRGIWLLSMGNRLGDSTFRGASSQRLTPPREALPCRIRTSRELDRTRPTTSPNSKGP